MKWLGISLLVFLSFIRVHGQAPDYQAKFSEPLAVFEFVENLSSNAPPNPFKKRFDSSGFSKGRYKALIDAFDQLNIDYSYEYTAYPYGQKIGGSTESLLKKNLIVSTTIQDFKSNALGIIPNKDLFALSAILSEFLPVYRELIYKPGKEKFEQQLADLKKLIVSKHIASYFEQGLTFYHSSWDSTLPFRILFYPLPDSKGFRATAFYNDAVCAIPASLKDYNIMLGVMLHETFHILYDEESLDFKKAIEKWFMSNPSPNSRYAYLLLNEALATSLGNGYVYGRLNGAEDTASWYKRKYTNLMAKKIYPLITSYIQNKQSIDQAFADNYIKTYDDNFAAWLSEMDNIMTDRYILSDNPDDLAFINRTYRYVSMSQSEDHISDASVEKMMQAPITKVVIISKDNKSKLQLVKQHCEELNNWEPDDQADFVWPVFLKDKTYLLIINDVKKTTAEQLTSFQLQKR